MVNKATFIYFIFNLLMFVKMEGKKFEPKVVGGDRAEIKNVGYSAFINIVDDTIGYMCGSSIVNQKVILTAAHCFDPVKKESSIAVSVGHEHNQMGAKMSLIGFKIHEKYDTISIANDIALGALKNPLSFGSKINRIAIAKYLPPTGVAAIAGWGLINEDFYERTDLLHLVKQKIWPRNKCEKKLRQIPKGTFCGGEWKSSKYPSLGDSGSALVLEGYKQIGIVSFKRMDVSKSLIVYTNVPHFYDWIKKNLVPVFCIDKRTW